MADGYTIIRPSEVLSEMVAALPEEVRDNIIIIGSLAAAYWLLDMTGVKTKDVDCVLTPRVEAVDNGKLIAEKLIELGWEQRKTKEFPGPGNEQTPEERLPAVRLSPPGNKNWFLELLAEPVPGQEEDKDWTRLALDSGEHFGIPSFRYISIAVFEARKIDLGFRVARPEMMALANLLEHRALRPDVIKGDPDGTKRCNKDLGRVLAIGYLTKDEDLLKWPEIWSRALHDRFPDGVNDLSQRVGDGLRLLLDSPEDMRQAFKTCTFGLLAGKGATQEQLGAVGRRVLGDVVEPL